MKIKLAKEKLQKTHSLKPKHSNPQEKACSNQNREIVLQSQFNSIRNYFSLMRHIFSRNQDKKKELKQTTKEDMQNQLKVDLPLTSIRDYNESDTIDVTIPRSSGCRTQPSPNRLSQQNYYRYGQHRPRWKQSILRRKNNGAHGEIFKGNPINNHSRLMKRVDEGDKAGQIRKDPQKDAQKLTIEDFVPLGRMNCPFNNVHPFKGIELKSTQVQAKASHLSSKKYSHQSMIPKGSKNSSGLVKQVLDNDLMSRTCFPLKSSIQMNDPVAIRKTIISTPYRYKSRVLTPCPWQYTSQR